jgi:hypothetical protein
MNSQGTHVHSFKAPSREELAHDFLWRVAQNTPRKGEIAIFNRSHYEDVLVVRVHKLVPKEVWSGRYDLIKGGLTIEKLVLVQAWREAGGLFDARERAARKQAKSSLLDAVSLEVARLNKTLPATDRTRLNDYLEDVREIERRLSLVAKSSEQSADVQVPFGIPESFSEHINLLWDLQVLAFRADITRVSTLMYAHDVSMRVYPESGVLSGNHPTSHHGGRPATVAVTVFGPASVEASVATNSPPPSVSLTGFSRDLVLRIFASVKAMMRVPRICFYD